ncbi:bifunctional 3-(3-hydroxy-phenyl)propionate/3-hydroxycinnamic acid hydroxylase MhpA [Ramlibacter sp. MAHUQ-53]|uniref:bifunctional 3-(3-hydroxy-phenyl)propionate/3-hydroxycinnamic acid hydroxylase MhpA n=1 Tax=unclassified Ramlibacter TaxID=2617605 RepID=UPI00362999D6
MTPGADDRVYDVALIGYGPAGATLANLLGRAGLSVLVLDREAGIYPLPRAIHFDGEVMRVFQSLGLRARVEAISRPGLQGMHFVNARGETLMVRGGTASLGPHGCATNYYFHQPELEQVLRDGVARFPKVQVRLRAEVTAIEEHADQVALTVTDRAGGPAFTARARWVVGCDGARSLVRRTLGSPMEDLGLRQPWLVFDVQLKDGAPALPEHTVQHCDPARPMTWCNVTGRRRRWEIMVMPGDDEADLVKPETLWKLVGRWMTPAHADIERAVIYTFHSQIAQGWRRGRLMLAGDAAHLTPPFLGQGMCAAIRDASNLAWKLAAVARGEAGDELLDTYEAERRPHVHAFISLAVRLGDVIQTTDPQAAAARDARYRAGEPEEFTFPAPRLGPGAWQGAQAAVARPFPQPRLADGRLLDEALDGEAGPRFAVIARPALLDAVPGALRQLWQDAGVAVLPAQDPALQQWLDAQGAQAVVLRPDRYVAGLASDPGELEAASACIPSREPQPH